MCQMNMLFELTKCNLDAAVLLEHRYVYITSHDVTSPLPPKKANTRFTTMTYRIQQN